MVDQAIRFQRDQTARGSSVDDHISPVVLGDIGIANYET